ncbi:phosphonopyruvate decarboxylase [Kitasatospora sp. NPDC057965]|uniref:phosphonopyruvate decarboxylase n=1 Tax=Kitasatospora sp. NPDC057965 TaxID=3346291 RepID=UPI0036D8F4C4
MITAKDFCAELGRRGFTLASGVPCSHFGGPIELLSRTPGAYVPAANEGGALAVAAGAAMAGRRAYVMLQNSGLGNLINPLTSLVMTYRLPVLTFVSLRGWPDPADDEPQHEVMGPTTHALLDALGLPHHTLHTKDDTTRFTEILDRVERDLADNRAPFVLVEKGAVGKAPDRPTTADVHPADSLSSADTIRLIAQHAGDAAIIATTGYTARELFGYADRPANFYMQGSMGHAPSIALGVALARPDRQVVVIDGDGAALMHLGTQSAIGDQAPANLLHVILDNGIHESTGGQRTTAGTTDFPAIARASGYRTAVRCTTLTDLTTALAGATATPGPHLIAVATRPRTDGVPPRATTALSAEGFRDRFASALEAGG